MDFGHCQTPPPASTPNLMYPSHAHQLSSYSVDLAARSVSVSDDELATGENTKHRVNVIDNNHLTVDHKKDVLSDEFEDEFGTDSDYLSSDPADDLFNNELDLKLNPDTNIPRNIKLLSAQTEKKKKVKSTKSNRSRLLSASVTDTELTTDSYLRLPINESDDNYEESLPASGTVTMPTMKKFGSANTLYIPNIDDDKNKQNQQHGGNGNGKCHIRSYSESNLHRDIQKNQWPSSEESDTSLDENQPNDIKARYVSMKKKYRKQRRISRQFQEAITVIQDNNEDHIIATEQQLRDQFAKEFELRLMELETHKLNDAITNDDKIKRILSQNAELMYENKQLQQQVAAQVAVIQQQQQMVTTSFVRMQSGDSIITNPNAILSPVGTMESPLATLGQFPSAGSSQQNILRRVSSVSSTMNTVPALPYHANIPAINAATTENLGLHLKDDHTTPSTEGNYTLHLHQDSHGSDETLKTCSIDSGDRENKDAVHNMEPSEKYKYNQNQQIRRKQQRKFKKKNYSKQKKIKRKKLQDLETRLLENDQEIQDKVGAGLTPWDRFLELLTPSFCSCSPSQQPQKTVVQ